MDKDYLQALRYKLQKRVRKLNSANPDIYQLLLKQLFAFLYEYKIFTGIIDRLEILSASHDISEEIENIRSKYNYQIIIDSEKNYAAMCYRILKEYAQSDNPHLAINIGHMLSTKTEQTECCEIFNEYFLEPFYEYIDENIDESGAILSLLRKYKERCEWFKRDELYLKWESDSQNGEKLLAKDMYEYLHDQGLDFFIEPSSASGEIDMISSQQGENRLLVDAKIFNPNKSKTTSYIAHGFNQIYSYTKDFNQPIGYLVIFKTCEHDLKFDLSEGASSIPFATHNNKTIFFITIDIYPYEKSASKRGSLRSYDITSTDLQKEIDSLTIVALDEIKTST